MRTEDERPRIGALAPREGDWSSACDTTDSPPRRAAPHDLLPIDRPRAHSERGAAWPALDQHDPCRVGYLLYSSLTIYNTLSDRRLREVSENRFLVADSAERHDDRRFRWKWQDLVREDVVLRCASNTL